MHVLYGVGVGLAPIFRRMNDLDSGLLGLVDRYLDLLQRLIFP